MADQPHKILLVEPDSEIVEIIVGSLSHRFDAQVTCVPDVESCLETDVFEPHDLFIAELELEDGTGLELADQLTVLGRRPVILMADEPTRDQTMEAMSLGVRAMLVKPFPVANLLGLAEKLLREQATQRDQAVKYRRMRELVRHVIRERRELNRRVELVCRDLVGAHKRLVHRVLDTESARPQSSG